MGRKSTFTATQKRDAVMGVLTKRKTVAETCRESRDGAKRTVARSLRPFISAWFFSERDADLQLSRWC